MDVGRWAEEWVAQEEARGARVSVKEWRAAGKALAMPSQRIPSRSELVATVIGYQLAELEAERRGA